MKAITIKLTNCLTALALGVAMCLSAVSCQKDELTDGDKFALYYPGITDIGPSTNMDLTPTYHGAKASKFEIYNVTLDGKTYQTESFSIDPESGMLSLRNTDGLPVGKYAISIQCVSGGQIYKFPGLVTVNMMHPVPEGIILEPSLIEVPLTSVTNLNLTDELPGARIITEGEHITVEDYKIAKVTLGGTLVEDWSGIFEVNSEGEFSILRNQNFLAGVYVIDFKLVTRTAGLDSSMGIYENALTVDVQAPPTSLTYSPSAVKVQYDFDYTSRAPKMVGSSNGLRYSILSVSPEGAPVTVDEKTGVINLSKEHDLPAGTDIVVSMKVENALGSMDFAQVFKITLVELINPITKLDYNDSTVWHDTKFGLAPKEVDGDEKIFSFVDLPEALSALKIDELTGKISAKKGNKIEIGEYTVKVAVENSKGSMTKEIRLTVIENPYFFTYVHWGNNLGLVPAENYASQHRVPTTETYTFEVAATDIKEDTEVEYTISGGSKAACAVIDPETGAITTNLAFANGDDGKPKMENFRAHFFFVTATTGKGTSGETSVKTPVFLDFNCMRAEGGYQITYTPFVFQCNPKNGGYSAVPEITKAGKALTSEELSKITMDFRRSFNYWNIGGPAEHANGTPNEAKDNFLSQIWAAYYAAINKAYGSGSRDPISYYGRAFLDKNPAYIRASDLALYIAPERWKDVNGYADGVFTAQITFADNGADPTGAANPYRLFPLFVWFDTEF